MHSVRVHQAVRCIRRIEVATRGFEGGLALSRLVDMKSVNAFGQSAQGRYEEYAVRGLAEADGPMILPVQPLKLCCGGRRFLRRGSRHQKAGGRKADRRDR